MPLREVLWSDPDAVALRVAQRAEIAQNLGKSDSDPDPEPTGRHIVLFLMMLLNNLPAACGGLRQLDGHTGEVTRIFVVRARRRTGVASQLLTELEKRARGLGWTRLRAAVGAGQPDALMFLTAHGYAESDDFNSVEGSTVVSLEKAL